MHFIITLKRAKSNGRFHYYQKKRVKRGLDPFTLYKEIL